MQVKSEVNAAGQTVMNLKGNWVTEPVMERLKRISIRSEFCNNASFTVDDKSMIIRFHDDLSEGHIAKLVEFVQDNLRPVIGSAFTVIRVNPYVNPLNGDKGGIDLLMMVADETGCDVDYGTWNSCVTLKPQTSTQYNEIVELLETFEMKFN